MRRHASAEGRGDGGGVVAMRRVDDGTKDVRAVSDADADARVTVQFTRGAEALRAFLAREEHVRVGRLADPEAFAAWVEGESVEYLCSNRATLLRVRAEAIRRHHADRLVPLVSDADQARRAFEASAEGADVAAAAKTLAHLKAAVAGMEAFLSTTETKTVPAASEALSSEDPKAPDVRGAKRLAVGTKLEAAKAQLPSAEAALHDATRGSELWRRMRETSAALGEFRRRIGLDAAEAEAAAESTSGGQALVSKGGGYELACRRAVRQLLRDDGSLLDGGDGSGAGAVFMLNNVTLGAHVGELDCVVVRVNRPEEAFTDAAPQCGDGVSRKAQGKRSAEGGATAAAAAAGDPPRGTRAPAVEVLMAMEFKRNPDDLARGFHSCQALLNWLTGGRYDPEEWRNKRHPSGHFVRGFHRMSGRRGGAMCIAGDDSAVDEADERLNHASRDVILTRDSFRRFRRDSKSGFLLGGCWLATRPKPLVGVEAKVRDAPGSHSPLLISLFTLSHKGLCISFEGAVFFFPFTFGRRIWGARALGPSGSSALNAPFIAWPRTNSWVRLRRAHEDLPSCVLLYCDL